MATPGGVLKDGMITIAITIFTRGIFYQLDDLYADRIFKGYS
jgi:hypothetical protein